jgi:putative membrane protein
MHQRAFYLLLLAIYCSQIDGVQASNIASAGTTIRATAASSKPALSNDAFVGQAILSSLIEIELAKTALQKTNDPQIQSFAQRMIVDNATTASELGQIAQDVAIDVPYQLDDAHLQVLDELNTLFGADFDSAFSAHMYEVQAKAVSLFSTAVHETSLQGVFRLFAMKTLSTLQAHKFDAADLTKKYLITTQPVIKL